MSLKKQLMDDLKESMKNKDSIKKNTITMIRASIKQIEVDERVEVDDNRIQDIISKQLKERRNSIEDFKKGDRQDLVDQTNEEIEILLNYLPKQLSEEELKEIVKEAIEEVNAKSMKDIGTIMKTVMPKIKGRADGNLVNKIIKEILN